MDWRLKSAVHGVVAALPRSRSVNRWLQRQVTRRTRIDNTDADERLAQVLDHPLVALERFGGVPVEDARIVELGNDWHLLVPMALAALGARRVLAFDVGASTRHDDLQSAAVALHSAIDRSTVSTRWDPHRRAVFGELASGVVVEPERLGIEVRTDLRDLTGVGDQTADVVFANNVLEHVAAVDLTRLLHELLRITTPGGVLCARIDMKDHFCRVDASITPFNYLRYSPRAWPLLQSRMEPQNRLRHSQYLECITAAGWTVVDDQPVRGDPVQLASVPVHRCFASFEVDDLLVLETWVVARRSHLPAGQGQAGAGA